MATDAADGKAVLRIEGALQVLRPGDSIQGLDARLESVLEDRVVVRETQGESGEGTRDAWIYLRDPATGASRIRYLQWRAEVGASPAPRPPAMLPQPETSESTTLRREAPVERDPPPASGGGGEEARRGG